MDEADCEDEKMKAYGTEARKLEPKFIGLELRHFLRRHNDTADKLAKLGSSRDPVPTGVFVNDQYKPSAQLGPDFEHPSDPTSRPAGDVIPDPAHSEAQVMLIDADWMGPYADYLLRDILPQDKTEAKQLARRAKSFVMVGNDLYKRSISGILQKCIPRDQGQQLLVDVHAGTCGHHAAPRELVGKAFRHGFYWPTAVADSEHIVRTCEGCQYYARQTHLPAQELQTIPITWPFAVWGLDLVGPLKKAPGGFTHLLVAVDKFTKWIEAKPIASVTAEQAVIFIRDIIHRFGVPNSIITDNGTVA